METTLQRVGLTRNEAKIYLALLRLGSTTAGPLIKELGMHRAAVYDTLDLLVEKGLVSFVIKANRKYFEAHDPERLLDYLENKKRAVERRSRILRRSIKKLQAMKNISANQQEGYVYKGKKGLKSVLEDILKEGRPYFVFGAHGQFREILANYYMPFHRRRTNLKIAMKIIRSERLRKLEEAQHLKLREVRYVPENYTTPSTTWIYGDKVAIIVWSPDPMAFVVRSRSVADSYRKYFEVLWKAAKA